MIEAPLEECSPSALIRYKKSTSVMDEKVDRLLRRLEK